MISSLIVLGIIALIIYMFREAIATMAGFLLLFVGFGALIGLIFGSAGTGAKIGFWVGVFIGIRLILDSLGLQFATIFEYGYYLFLIPVWFSNRLQHILVEPWRYIFKSNWVGESERDDLRAILYFVQILLYSARVSPSRENTATAGLTAHSAPVKTAGAARESISAQG